MTRTPTLFALAAAALLAACAGRATSEPNTTDAASVSGGGTNVNARGDTLRVRFGQTVELQRTGLRVTFQRFLADSRCPINAICVWEGDAAVSVRLQRNGLTSDQELHTSARMGATSVAFEGYEIRLFGLTPAPEEGKPRPPESELTALLVVKAR